MKRRIGIWVLIFLMLLGAGCAPSAMEMAVETATETEAGSEVFPIVLYGKLGSSDLRMQFREERGSLIGSYAMDGGEEMPIEGYPHEGGITLSSWEDNVYLGGACFYAQINEAYDMQGVCVNGDETLPFRVSSAGVKDMLCLPSGDILTLSGEWYGVHTDYYYRTFLYMRPISDDVLRFQMATEHGAGAGTLSGLAKYDGTAAVYTTQDYDSTEVQFVFAKNEAGQLSLSVTGNKYWYGCGAHAHFDNEFRREPFEQVVPKPEALTDEQFEALKMLLGDDFGWYAAHSEYWDEHESIDEFEADVYTLGITGFPNSSMIVLNRNTGTIMLALEVEPYTGECLYFSNDPDYQESPKSIQRHLEERKYILRSQNDE